MVGSQHPSIYSLLSTPTPVSWPPQLTFNCSFYLTAKGYHSTHLEIVNSRKPLLFCLWECLHCSSDNLGFPPCNPTPSVTPRAILISDSFCNTQSCSNLPHLFQPVCTTAHLIPKFIHATHSVEGLSLPGQFLTNSWRPPNWVQSVL